MLNPNMTADVPSSDDGACKEQGFGYLCCAKFEIRTIDEARRLAAFLSSACPELGMAQIGLLELLVNSVEHGNLGITYDEKTELVANGEWLDEIERRLGSPQYAARRSTVAFEQDRAGLRISIQDEGDGFDPTPFMTDTDEFSFAAHGRGILLARKIGFSSLVYEDGGRRVVVTLDF